MILTTCLIREARWSFVVSRAKSILISLGKFWTKVNLKHTFSTLAENWRWRGHTTAANHQGMKIYMVDDVRNLKA